MHQQIKTYYFFLNFKIPVKFIICHKNMKSTCSLNLSAPKASKIKGIQFTYRQFPIYQTDYFFPPIYRFEIYTTLA